MDESIVKNDLLHRFAGYSFVETAINDMTLVEFKDVGLNVVSATKKPSIVDCYSAIREDVLDGRTPLFLSTTTQRDALTNVDTGLPIWNITLGLEECFDDTTWVSAEGVGRMSPVAYGNMFEDSASGSAMNGTTKQWITANGGVFDPNNLISFLNHADGDRLVVGTGGSGDYMVVASCGQTNSGSNRTTMEVHISDNDTTVIKDDQNANSTDHRPLVANGILALLDDDYLTLHIFDPDTPSNVIKIFDCHLTIQRIS